MSKDRTRQRAHHKKWVANNPTKWKAAHKRAKKKLIQKRIKLIQKSKATPCADCGVLYPSYVMDFDHRPGTKKEFSDWSQSVGLTCAACCGDCEV